LYAARCHASVSRALYTDVTRCRRILITPAATADGHARQLAAGPTDEVLRPRRHAVRVLVVEDEVVLAAAITRGLRREGMAIDVAFDGADALEKAAINRYEVIVLDRDLPGVHGDEVCRKLAAEQTTSRILMLTAAGTVDDRVEGLNLGADDYLGKPFAFSELLARIRALARRGGEPTPPVLSRHDVVLDPARREATRGGHYLRLTRKEFGVLEVLLAADGAVISAEELLERVWDEHADPFTHTVRVTVMNLRRKLGKPPLIETVIGAGYRL
jgi:DNA-binding response OmpR family regulator